VCCSLILRLPVLSLCPCSPRPSLPSEPVIEKRQISLESLRFEATVSSKSPTKAVLLLTFYYYLSGTHTSDPGCIRSLIMLLRGSPLSFPFPSECSGMVFYFLRDSASCGCQTMFSSIGLSGSRSKHSIFALICFVAFVFLLPPSRILVKALQIRAVVLDHCLLLRHFSRQQSCYRACRKCLRPTPSCVGFSLRNLPDAPSRSWKQKRVRIENQGREKRIHLILYQSE
jgi:hypothetical protein